MMGGRAAEQSRTVEAKQGGRNEAGKEGKSEGGRTKEERKGEKTRKGGGRKRGSTLRMRRGIPAVEFQSDVKTTQV